MIHFTFRMSQSTSKLPGKVQRIPLTIPHDGTAKRFHVAKFPEETLPETLTKTSHKFIAYRVSAIDAASASSSSKRAPPADTYHIGIPSRSSEDHKQPHSS
jgi:hypothetical protein